MSSMENLIIWNQEEDTSSMIGVDGTEENSPTRDDCKFGNGIEVTGYTGTTQREIYAVSSSGTHVIDFFWKAHIINTSMESNFLVHLEPTAGQGTEGDIRFLYNGASDQWRLQIYRSGQQNIFYDTTASTFSADDILHIRFIVSTTAFDGSDKVSLYINGARLSVDSGDETQGLSGSVGGDLCLGNLTYVDRGMRGIIDNTKYYDVANTDISNDLNNEGYGGRRRRT